MILRIAELDIDPKHIDTYRGLLAEEIEASVRLEPGVLFLFAMAMKEHPHRVRVVEGYADQAAYEAHPQTPHFVRYRSGTDGMVLSLKLMDADPIAIHSKGWTKLPT